MKPRRTNLLVVCAGNASLHREWVAHRESFDIMTIYFGDDEGVAEEYRSSSDFFFRAKGLKISLARDVLLLRLLLQEGFPFTCYEHIWFPDDDLRFHDGPQAVEALFQNAARTSADVFQPAIQNEHYSSGWEATRLLPGAFAHRVNIVEVMAFGFSGEVFSKCFLSALHALDFMKSGWGIEPVWTRIGEVLLQRSLRTYVFDATPVVHTRPAGGGDSIVHKRGRYEALFMPQIETNRMRVLAVYENLDALRNDGDTAVFHSQAHVDALHDAWFADFCRRTG